MGRARDRWERLGAAFEKQDTEGLADVYADESVFLEPHNPPHEGRLLIQAYLNSWLQAREDVAVTVSRVLESDDGTTLAVEWTLSYSAAGRRWHDLPRASWIEADDEGIRYHRDYF